MDGLLPFAPCGVDFVERKRGTLSARRVALRNRIPFRRTFGFLFHVLILRLSLPLRGFGQDRRYAKHRPNTQSHNSDQETEGRWGRLWHPRCANRRQARHPLSPKRAELRIAATIPCGRPGAEGSIHCISPDDYRAGVSLTEHAAA